MILYHRFPPGYQDDVKFRPIGESSRLARGHEVRCDDLLQESVFPTSRGPKHQLAGKQKSHL